MRRRRRQRRVRPLVLAASSTSSPSRAPTTSTGAATLYYKDDSSRSRAAGRTTATPRTSSDFDQGQAGVTLGGPDRQDRLFYFLAVDDQRGALDQADRPEPHRAAAWSTTSLELGSPRRERLDRAHQRRPRVPRQDRLAGVARAPRSPCRYNYTWAEQNNGTFDVDSWGRSANADREGLLQRRHRLARSRPSPSTLLQRVPLPVRAGGPAAAVRRPDHHRAEPAAARHRLRLRHAATASACRSSSRSTTTTTRIQFNDNISSSRATTRSRPGVEYNRGDARPDVPRVRQRHATSSARPTAS